MKWKMVKELQDEDREKEGRSAKEIMVGRRRGKGKREGTYMARRSSSLRVRVQSALVAGPLLTPPGAEYPSPDPRRTAGLRLVAVVEGPEERVSQTECAK